MSVLFPRLLRLLQRSCSHYPGHVVADLLQRDYPDVAVRWCRDCGAVAIDRPRSAETEWDEMRLPEPSR